MKEGLGNEKEGQPSLSVVLLHFPCLQKNCHCSNYHEYGEEDGKDLEQAGGRADKKLDVKCGFECDD